MKKFLSLAMALVMTFSLVTISAGAKDFTDDSKITYEEAVDVVSAVGIVDGYADGSFNPTATLTRGAAAKIICNLILGPTTASALSADSAPYSDVPANSTFAGYIAYCQKAGIISGYSDGTFRPSATLTSYAFMKMLLGALGYDSTIEGYTGANWSINVAKRALNVGLDDGLVSDFVGTKAVTREEACLFAFNTLKADVVEYADKGTNITVGDITVNTGASSAKTASQGSYPNNMNKTGLQFGEQYFSKLTMAASHRDDFGRPATTWLYKSEKIGTYAETPDVSYSADVKANAIYADLGMTTPDTADIYENGNTVTGTIPVAKSNSDKVSTVATSTGNGSIVEVYRNEDTNDVDIVVISVYVGEVTRTYDATSTKDAYIVVNDLGGTIAGFNDEFETEAFEEDQIVAFTYSETAAEIKTVEALESVSGSLSKRVIGSSLTLGETTYKYAKKVVFDNLTEVGLSNKSEYIVYLDANGYAIYVTEVEFTIEDYALVKDIRSATAWNSNQAKLVFTDGTTKTVTLAKDYLGLSTVAQGDIVGYQVEDDGDYKLTALASDVAFATDATFTMSKNKAAVTVAGGTIYADSRTVFVIKDNGGDWKVYTGIKNAPNVAPDAGTSIGYFCKTGTVASIVFIETTTASLVTGSSNDLLYVAGKSASKRIIDIDGNSYYTYNAVYQGEITTIMVDATSTPGSLVPGAKTNIVFSNVTIDSNDIITDAVDFAASPANPYALYEDGSAGTQNIKKMTGSYSIQLDDLLWTVAADANIYYVDTDGVIEKVALSSIKTDNNDTFIAIIEDGEITNLFVQEV